MPKYLSINSIRFTNIEIIANSIKLDIFYDIHKVGVITRSSNEGDTVILTDETFVELVSNYLDEVNVFVGNRNDQILAFLCSLIDSLTDYDIDSSQSLLAGKRFNSLAFTFICAMIFLIILFPIIYSIPR